jgi:uncharacterized membrane protein YcfT
MLIKLTLGVSVALLVVRFAESSFAAYSAVFLAIIYFVYLAWAAVSFWRCAFNVKYKIGAYLMRSYIIMMPITCMILSMRQE